MIRKYRINDRVVYGKRISYHTFVCVRIKNMHTFDTIWFGMSLTFICYFPFVRVEFGVCIFANDGNIIFDRCYIYPVAIFFVGTVVSGWRGTVEYDFRVDQSSPSHRCVLYFYVVVVGPGPVVVLSPLYDGYKEQNDTAEGDGAARHVESWTVRF